MNPKYGLCCLSIVLLVSLQSCLSIVTDRQAIHGSGKLSEETYKFSGLTGVQLTTRGELDIRLGDMEELRIEADENLLHYFEAEKDGDVLRIGTRQGFSVRPSGAVHYTLTVKELESIGLSSSGNAHAPAIATDHFEIRISSSGDLSMDGIEASSLDVQISSSGDVKIGEGLVDKQEIRISSSGDYYAESVRSGEAKVRSSSSGDARLWAEESLDATLSSSGSVYYKGDPKIDDSHSSSGRVRRIR